jgi:hypothetical protein
VYGMPPRTYRTVTGPASDADPLARSGLLPLANHVLTDEPELAKYPAPAQAQPGLPVVTTRG